MGSVLSLSWLYVVCRVEGGGLDLGFEGSGFRG